MSLRVLVADDSDDIVASLVLLLTIDGHITQGVSNGRDALRVAEEFHPDVAILDIGMPPVSGLDVCRQLRTKPWAQSLHIVAISGWSHDVVATKDAGFNAHFVKPMDWEILRKELAAL